MKILFAIVSDNAFTDQSERLTIIQRFDTISSPGFPTIHPRLAFTSSIDLEEQELGKEHEYKVELVNRNTKEVAAEWNKKFQNDTKNNQFVTYFNNVVFKEPGFYDFNIVFDNKKHPQVTHLEVKSIET